MSHRCSQALIDDVGLGWGVGEVGGVLITSLWTFIYMMISFCSLLPQYHMTQMLCILHSLISFHFISFHFISFHFIPSFILFFSFIHSFIHSVIHSVSRAKWRVQPRSPCTTEQIQARVQTSKFRVHSRGSALTTTLKAIPTSSKKLLGWRPFLLVARSY